MRKLIDAVHRGEVCTLAVWRLDRLGRTAKGLTALFEDLQNAKVNLVSLKDGLDLSTPAGRLMANVLASVAMFETEIRAERVLAGQADARAKGKTWGGSKPGRLVSVTAEQVETVRRLKGEGRPVTAIARAVHLSRPTIYRILDRREPAP
jgi:DNA invertase Pin-like site-specific DNA recombinase